MSQSTYVGFPNCQMTVVSAIGAANTAITRGTIKRGTTYRVVSDVDCWISLESPAAANTGGMYLPAKTVNYFCFGSRDPQGTDVEVNVISSANGYINFTPILPIF